MAFKLENFGAEVANAKSTLGGICYYRYFNEENNTLTTAGYFPATLGLEVGDRIRVIPSVKTNADEIYIVTSTANRTVTVKQIDTDGAVDSVNGKTGAVVLGANDVLPTQTGNAGKFLITNGTDASWSDKPLQNTATGTDSLTVLGDATTQNESINIGAYSQANGQQATVVGKSAAANRSGIAIGCGAVAGSYSIAIGGTASGTSWSDPRIAIGNNAVSGAAYAIQIGANQTTGSTNSDSKTVKIYNGNGNFEIMSADGTIPAARHASLPAADGTYVLKLVIASGVPTLSWVAE